MRPTFIPYVFSSSRYAREQLVAEGTPTPIPTPSEILLDVEGPDCEGPGVDEGIDAATALLKVDAIVVIIVEVFNTVDVMVGARVTEDAGELLGSEFVAKLPLTKTIRTAA
jgi:hypothetical protein